MLGSPLVARAVDDARIEISEVMEELRLLKRTLGWSASNSPLLVAPPQYEVLYATHYNFHNNAHNAIQIAVVGDRVQVSYVGNTQPYQTPRLWRFDPKTGAVREIAPSSTFHCSLALSALKERQPSRDLPSKSSLKPSFCSSGVRALGSE